MSFIKCKQTDEKVLIANRLRKILSKKMDEYDHYDDDGFDAQEAEYFKTCRIAGDSGQI